MLKNTYTEEEFKKMVKTLLVDKQVDAEPEVDVLRRQLEKVKPAFKKLVIDLKETREEIEKLKMQTNENDLALLEQRHLAELLAIKKEHDARLSEAEGKNEAHLYSQEILRLEKVVEEEKKKSWNLEEEFKAACAKFEEKEKSFFREEAKFTNFEEERVRLVEKLAESVALTQRQSDQIRELRGDLDKMQLKTGQLEKVSLEQKEEAESLKSACNTFSRELEKKESELETFKQKLVASEIAFKESDHYLLKKEYEEKLLIVASEAKLRETGLLAEKDRALEALKLSSQADEMFQRQEKERLLAELMRTREEFTKILSEKEKSHEEILGQSYAKLKEIFQKNAHILEENHGLKESVEEKQEQLSKREQEIENRESLAQNLKSKVHDKEMETRKAQSHLAKKVKENALLRDVLERQKAQLIEQQTLLQNHKNEIEKMKGTLHLQRLHEEKLEAMSKERAQAAETLSKEWQDKYFALHLEWQEGKAQIAELMKMKKHHGELQATFASLKSLLKGNEPQEEDFFES